MAFLYIPLSFYIYLKLLLRVNSFSQCFDFTLLPLGNLALPLLTFAATLRCAHNFLDLHGHLLYQVWFAKHNNGSGALNLTRTQHNNNFSLFNEILDFKKD
ncbi:hypothetical protein CUC08_Gglean012041 [Alternaria sp. MG1]|nr:hypothetical protein CUC08_Gglean012041 [Alternaria sp. MG1]